MGNIYTRFIVLGEGRTGSNLLVQLLNAHPAVVCFREIFNWAHSRIDYQMPEYEAHRKSDVKFRREDPLGFLRARVYCDWPPNVRAVGFKLHYGHAIGYQGLEEALVGDRELKVIHLRRQNLLRTYVSFLNADRTGVWERHASEPFRTRVRRLVRRVSNRLSRNDLTGPLEVRVEELQKFAITYILQGRRYDELFAGHQRLHLTYESMVAQQREVLSASYRFLEVEDIDAPEVTLRRQNPEPLRELIANYDELRAAYAGRPEEVWFDD